MKMRTWTTKEFREYCLAKYPALVNNEMHRKVFRYLCFSTLVSYDPPHNLLIPTKQMSIELEGKHWDRNFSLIKILDAFKKEVLPELEISDWSALEGLSREIICTGFDQEMKDKLFEEFNTGYRSNKDKVFFVSGRADNKPNRKIENDKYLKEYDEMLTQVKRNPTQQMIIDYMRQVNGAYLFPPKRNENDQLIEAEIAKLKAQGWPKELEEIQRKKLYNMANYPQPLYFSIEGYKTHRIYGNGENPVSIKKEIRKALCHGWTEIDLQAAQFTILSTLLGAPLAKNLILLGKETIWENLYAFTHPQNAGQKPPAEIKDVYKEILYSIAFGRNEKHGKNTKSTKEDIYTILERANLLSVLEHPIIRELIEYRKLYYQNMSKTKFAIDAFGGKHWISKTRKQHQILATVAQSYELAIFSAVYEEAIKHQTRDHYQIVLHIHDGAVISITDKANTDKIKRNLSRAVEEKARTFNIKTTLEFKDL
jgi:hypothetical protein